ncbi:LOW QUALITY PROTEIN: protein ITPRID1 [Spea bombifrons]|uniref:LOW QUALITY PROTEIN: protein ITPRID1 n=1 Tax=Spea bombifrons TaxID=233779 RepID=UPI00234A4837|nr:LOW QUALITY PROTEIN: protein ITPRID1 [Spea bombifrons]
METFLNFAMCTSQSCFRSSPFKSLPEAQRQAGSIPAKGMIKVSVKDYMSSLHTYMETPSTPRWDTLTKSVSRYPKSISDLLKLCEADPVDLLIDLGFGVDEPDLCTKIPSRFIMNPSEAKGINIRVFLEAQKKRLDFENPNLCGRFRQLEVLEQVTSAFSSLLTDVQTSEEELKDRKKSTLNQEKRKRIRQLLWKFSKQSKALDQNANQFPKNTEHSENQDEKLNDMSNTKVYRKPRRHLPEHGSVTFSPKETILPATNMELCSQNEKNAQSFNITPVPMPVKQINRYHELPSRNRKFKGQKTCSKALRMTSGQQHRLQPPDSFELEEVQSFEEEYPKTINQDNLLEAPAGPLISVYSMDLNCLGWTRFPPGGFRSKAGVEMTRTNSCQSDSSGFQDEPPEHLQNLHGSLNFSSNSTDSQTTLMEKNIQKCSGISDDENGHELDKEFGKYEVPSRGDTVEVNQEKHRVLSINTENSNGVFQSFESSIDEVDKGVLNEMHQRVMLPETNQQGIGSESEEHYLQGCGPNVQMEDEYTNNDVSEVDFPVYKTHYIGRAMGSDDYTYGLMHEEQNSPDKSVSDLEDKSNTGEDMFENTFSHYHIDSLVEVSEMKCTPLPISGFPSFCSPIQNHGSFSDHQKQEPSLSYENKKSTFQTKLSTNIYKSVTIQMSPPLIYDSKSTNGYLRSQHSFHSTITEQKENNAEKKEAFSQTDMNWSNNCTNCYRMLHRDFLTESLCFDTGLCGLYHPCHISLQGTGCHCCHCCHCHHCCFSGLPSAHNHIGSLGPNLIHSNLEKELTETLILLKESLTNISLCTGNDIENIKKACNIFRNQLLDIEQLLTEQQAGCFHILSSEEREEIRRLYLLRRSVLKEMSELEFHLDERAHHVKETISMQLEQALEEQSRLYAELEFSSWQREGNNSRQYGNLQTRTNFTSSASSKNKSHETPIHAFKPDEIQKEQLQSHKPKTDFSSILQNIKKSFGSFKNS